MSHSSTKKTAPLQKSPHFSLDSAMTGEERVVVMSGEERSLRSASVEILRKIQPDGHLKEPAACFYWVLQFWSILHLFQTHVKITVSFTSPTPRGMFVFFS